MGNTRIYVGNLPTDIRESELERMFDKFGPIQAVDVKRPNRGPYYAFLEFKSQQDAEIAIREVNNSDFAGKRLVVEQSKGGKVSASSRGPPRRSEFRVLVFRLPSNTSWQDLKDYMKTVGDVGYTNILRDRNGSHVGVVEYTSENDMVDAIERLNNTEFTNKFGDKSSIQVEEDKGGHDLVPIPPPARDRPRYDDRDRGRYHDDRDRGRYYEDRDRGRYHDDRRGGYYDDRRGGGHYEDRGRHYDDRRYHDDRRGGGHPRDRYEPRRGSPPRGRSRSRDRARYEDRSRSPPRRNGSPRHASPGHGSPRNDSPRHEGRTRDESPSRYESPYSPPQDKDVDSRSDNY